MTNTTTTTATATVWGTSKTHQLVDGGTYLYLGDLRKAANSKPVLVTATNQGRNGWTLTNQQGKVVYAPAPATRYWLAPAPAKAPSKATQAKAAKALDKALDKGVKVAPAKAVKATPAKAVKAAPAKAEAKAPAVAAKGHPGHTWFSLVEKAGTTRMNVARTMGVAPMSLHRLIAGDAVPSARMTVAFAKAINELGGKADVQALWTEVAAYELQVALGSKG